LPQSLILEIGPSGVLVGKLSNGDRLMIPVTDAGELSRVFVAADDAIAKRIVIRTAGAGERVCVHTRDLKRWASVRMPVVSVVSTSRPAPRTTVSVVEHARPDARDVAISPAPRPATVITVAPAGTALPDGHGHAFEVAIEQVSGATVRVTAAGETWLVDMDLFRAENRYVNLESVAMSFAT
jgi:hypothetical protein